VDARVEELFEKQAVVEAITRLFVATDRRDWPALRDCLAAEVDFDMSSLGAGPSRRRAAAEIVADWTAGLAPLEAIHHQAGNFLVDVTGERATAFCYGIAIHYLPNPSGRNTRTFVGSYDFELARDPAGWRITAFRFEKKYVEGNLELESSR
jgi:hypothetical protein